MTDSIFDQSSPSSAGPTGSASRRYIVVMLMLMMVVSSIDRQALTVMLEPIKHDLKLSGTQLGLLTGLFFAGFYVMAGIPLARLSDLRSRPVVIALCLAGFSLATALTGLVRSFAQLALCRMFVAVGEAGSFPAASSLIADLLLPRERVRIFALMSSGSAIGIAFGIFLGGTLNDLFGWRAVFFLLGLPGLLGGNLICGALAHRLGAHDIRWLGWIAAIGLFGCFPLGFTALFVADDTLALVSLCAFMVTLGFFAPPAAAIAVGLVHPRSRALVSSTIPLYQSLGGALGPVLVGFLNDGLFAGLGPEAIRYSLAVSLVGVLAGGIAALAAAHGLPRQYDQRHDADIVA